MLLSKEWNTTPFDILSKDIDDFIMLANYLVGLGEKSQGSNNDKKHKDDGFWDF